MATNSLPSNATCDACRSSGRLPVDETTAARRLRPLLPDDDCRAAARREQRKVLIGDGLGDRNPICGNVEVRADLAEPVVNDEPAAAIGQQDDVLCESLGHFDRLGIEAEALREEAPAVEKSAGDDVVRAVPERGDRKLRLQTIERNAGIESLQEPVDRESAEPRLPRVDEYDQRSP